MNYDNPGMCLLNAIFILIFIKLLLTDINHPFIIIIIIIIFVTDKDKSIIKNENKHTIFFFIL
jgi:hypothetical protein